MKYLWCVIILLLLLCGFLIYLLISNYKKQQELAKLIEKYLIDSKVPEYSVDSDNFSRLYNDVCDLCDRLEVQKQNSINDNMKSAKFVADVSHQLKTPLAGIRLYAEMNQSEHMSPNSEKELKLIEKMEDLIYRLLRLEKLKADSYKMDFKYNNVADIVNELVNDFKEIYEKKKYFVCGQSTLRCDKNWISEAIGNLIKNASEHTSDDGGIHINIEECEKSTIISVNDNGGGILNEELSNIFDRFHRVSSSNNSSGAGLGLAITKEIVEKHHGTIYAENRNGGLNIIMCFPHVDAIEKI